MHLKSKMLMLNWSPKAKWNFIRIVPFGIIWFVTGMVFLASDALAIGDNPVLEGAVRPNADIFVLAGVATTIMGFLVGIMEMVFVDRLFRRLSLWKTILYKFIFYTLLFTVVIALLYPVAASLEMGVSLTDERVKRKFITFWGSLAFWSTGLQLTFSLLLSLIYAAVSENLGHSVLVNFFTGKYHTPKQEERLFLFVDMYDSTAIAEGLGHIRYFRFLQQYYDDMANAIIKNAGEVYQYIGDEIVITWPKAKGVKNGNCLQCFFDMKSDLQKKAQKYQKEFGYVPRFKGGMHLGAVTTGEVGALKKEIVYTGDVLNTAARIQGLCTQLGKDLLVSREVLDHVQWDDSKFHSVFQDEFELKGKNELKEVYSLERT